MHSCALRSPAAARRPDWVIGFRALLPNVLEVRLEYPRQEQARVEPIRGLTPREQYARYLTEGYGTEPDDSELDLFGELLSMVTP